MMRSYSIPKVCRLARNIFGLSAAWFSFAVAAPTSVYATEIVNVYTSREPKLVQPVFDAFTKRTGITVRPIFLSRGLEERIAAEGASSPADLILVVDAGRIVAAKEAGLTRPLTPELLNAVPAHLRDADRHWTAVTLRARIVYASKERVKRDAITYEELAGEAVKGRLCMRSGKHEYNIALFSAVIERLGAEKAVEWLAGVKGNLARKASGGDRDVAKDIAAGLCDFGIANTYYLGLMAGVPEQRPWADAVKPLKTTFRAGGTHVNVSAAAITRHAPNAANAEKLLAYMLSQEAQMTFADLNYEYPVIPGTEMTGTEKLFGKIEPDKMSLTTVAAHRATASELVDKVGFDR